MRDLRDDEAWQNYLDEHLTPQQQDRLQDLYVIYGSFLDDRLGVTPAGRFIRMEDVLTDTDMHQVFAYRNWAVRVIQIEVGMRPGGRAILRHPQDKFTVEIQWLLDDEDKVAKPVSFHIVGDEFLFAHEVPSVTRYMAALDLRRPELPQGWARRIPRRRPQPGKALDPDFYRRVLAVYEGLLGEGYKDPAAELARRMKANRSTVKSWLRRGRQYLEEER